MAYATGCFAVEGETRDPDHLANRHRCAGNNAAPAQEGSSHMSNSWFLDRRPNETPLSWFHMTRVIVDMSPSLDGFVAGTGVSVDAPFGAAGHRLHRWLGFEGTTPEKEDHEAASQMLATAGAVVIGRRMFDVGIELWGEDGAWGMPCFVVTHRVRKPLVRGPTVFTFVTEGVEAAVSKARSAAGCKDIVIAGGADIAQQCIALGLVNELRLHVVPVLLGQGTRIFSDTHAGRELRLTKSVSTSNAVHQNFELIQ